MIYRNYKPSDHDALIALWQQVFPDDPPHNEPSAVLDAKLKVDDLIMVADDDGNLAAACMAGYDGHRGWLYAVAVLPQHQHKGIGTALVENALQTLQSIGCIKVNLQIRSDNDAVMEFYRSLGFEIEDRISMGRHLEPGRTPK